MSKTEEVQKAMIAAMKNKDKATKETLTVLLSALKGKAKDKQEPLTAEEEDAIVMREVKQTKETLASAPTTRVDIIEKAEERLKVLAQFAPTFLGEDDILAVVNEALKDLGLSAPTMRDKGAVMQKIMPQLKGKAEGALINEIVTRRLQS